LQPLFLQKYVFFGKDVFFWEEYCLAPGLPPLGVWCGWANALIFFILDYNSLFACLFDCLEKNASEAGKKWARWEARKGRY
jgi:hypothetical protein